MEQLAKMARDNELMCEQEVKNVLLKYGCMIHFGENKVDGQVVSMGIFFKCDLNKLMANTVPAPAPQG